MLLVVVVTLMVAGVALWVSSRCPWESATERAHRICGECGLRSDETDQLIGDMQHSTLTREENLELFYATFEVWRDAELCEPCAQAVLDAAEEE